MSRRAADLTNAGFPSGIATTKGDIYGFSAWAHAHESAA